MVTNAGRHVSDRRLSAHALVAAILGAPPEDATHLDEWARWIRRQFDVNDLTNELAGMTFGIGPHYCLGVNAARAQLEEALGFLAPQMPSLALDGEPELGGVEGLYEIKTLPLRWTATG